MDKATASKLIEANLMNIYGWSFSRMYDKTEAEDLAQDIIYNVLKSVDRLENDDAFYGFLWKIAENIFKAKIRKKTREAAVLQEDDMGIYWPTPEEKYINEEEIQCLRRELSLLAGQYREVTVRYYIRGKSCSEISAELDISVDMVKYYLFKTRKILKEGIGMNREFGEMSYNPKIFRMDFWGNGDNSVYWELFKRKLPGNILLAAADKPLTLTELSLELGVATAYLEDEVDILEEHDILKKIGDKYQTNIIIFTNEYEKKVLEKCRPVYEMSAQLFSRVLGDKLPELKMFRPYRTECADNSYRWIFANLALVLAACRFDKKRFDVLGEYPPLSNGSCGFIYGYDNEYENLCFNGIYRHYGHERENAWISVINYCLFEDCQSWKPHGYKTVEAMLDAVNGKEANEENDELLRMIEEGFIFSDKGTLSPNFPVFSRSEMEKAELLLEPLINVAYDCMAVVCDIAAEMLKNTVPKIHRERCEQLACIRFQNDAMAHIMNALVEQGQLIMPEGKANLCMFGVKTDSAEREVPSC